MEKVFLSHQEVYDIDKIEACLLEGLDFLELELPERSNILLKPNVLGAYPPEMHITTHPAVVEAVIRLLKQGNNRITIGDSSGAGQHGNTGRALKKSGLQALAEKYKVEVVSFDKHGSIRFENTSNRYLKRVHLTSFIDEMDWVINLPKLKSHQLMSYTGAVKNLFGCVPGAGKLTCHITAPQAGEFAHLLLDIYSFIRPKIFLNIMDGICGIEGAGPGPAGKVMKPYFMAMGKNAMAVDITCLEVLGKKPLSVSTVAEGKGRGFHPGKIETNISLPPRSFKMPRPNYFIGLLHKIFPGVAQSKPVTVNEKCVKCAICAKVCPGKVITMDEYPVYNYKTCIYCYCCHENCPEAAIELKEHWMLKISKLFEKKE